MTSTTAPPLWKTIGGLKKAQEVNREIAKYVDVMIGTRRTSPLLGFEVKVSITPTTPAPSNSTPSRT